MLRGTFTPAELSSAGKKEILETYVKDRNGNIVQNKKKVAKGVTFRQLIIGEFQFRQILHSTVEQLLLSVLSKTVVCGVCLHNTSKEQVSE